MLATVAGLTVAHFALALGGLGWLATNALFVVGLAVCAVVLTRNTRFAEREIGRAFSSLQRSYLEAVQALSGALDARDGYTADHADHADHVVEMALETGRALNMDADELDTLRTAALFHDIGKIGVPDRVLNKPGALTDDERADSTGRCNTSIEEVVMGRPSTRATSSAPSARPGTLTTTPWPSRSSTPSRPS